MGSSQIHIFFCFRFTFCEVVKPDPVSFVSLKLVNRYRKTPILNHDWIEPFFQKERVIKEEDVEEIFEHAEREIDLLSEKLFTKLRERFNQFSQISGDAAFIKLDMNVVSSVLEEIISEMPE